MDASDQLVLGLSEWSGWKCCRLVCNRCLIVLLRLEAEVTRLIRLTIVPVVHFLFARVL